MKCKPNFNVNEHYTCSNYYYIAVVAAGTLNYGPMIVPITLK